MKIIHIIAILTTYRYKQLNDKQAIETNIVTQHVLR